MGGRQRRMKWYRSGFRTASTGQVAVASKSAHAAKRAPWLIIAVLLIVIAAASFILRPANTSDTSTSILPGLKLGEAAPAFHLRDLKGNSVSLGDYRGRWLLLNFWGVTCVPCKSEMPALEAAYQKVSGPSGGANRPEILGIDGNLDSVSAVKNFLRGTHVTYPVAVDTLLSTVIAYHVGGIPTSVLVDPGGKMRYMHVGPLTESEIERALRGDARA